MFKKILFIFILIFAAAYLYESSEYAKSETKKLYEKYNSASLQARDFQRAGMFKEAEVEYKKSILAGFEYQAMRINKEKKLWIKSNSERAELKRWYMAEPMFELLRFYIETRQLEKARVYSDQIWKEFKEKEIDRDGYTCKEIDDLRALYNFDKSNNIPEDVYSKNYNSTSIYYILIGEDVCHGQSI
jgi:hypothetical protein